MARHLRILSDDDVKAAIDSKVALNIARKTLRAQAADGVALSSPSAMALDGVAVGGPRFKFKAAAIGYLNASGIRLVGRNPKGAAPTNYCAIFDHDSAELIGLVPDYWLSRIRTAAFGIAVAEQLVSAGPLVVALFGSGAIAREMAPIISDALDVAELRIHSRRPESMDAFAAQVRASTSISSVNAVHARENMIPGADLVITLTESRTPLVFPGETKPGAVVCSMGSHNELEFGVLQESQRLIVDDPDYAAEAGDAGAWISQGHLTLAQFRERVDALACEVAAGSTTGRSMPDDRIVAILQGMAIGDIAFAAHALQASERAGRGTLVPLA